MASHDYDSPETYDVVSFARRFADVSLMRSMAGIWYPEFHPGAKNLADDFGSSGCIVRPNIPSFNYLMVGAFPEGREFEVAMHFTQPAPSFFDLLNLVGSNGDFFLYDEAAERNKKYEKEVDYFAMQRMESACNQFEDVGDMVKFVREHEQEHPATVYSTPSSRDAMGFFRVRTPHANEAQLYARVLCDLARRRYP